MEALGPRFVTVTTLPMAGHDLRPPLPAPSPRAGQVAYPRRQRTQRGGENRRPAPYTVMEAAELTGCAPGTARSHLARAMTTPRNELGDE